MPIEALAQHGLGRLAQRVWTTNGVDEDVGVDEARAHDGLLSLETGTPGAVDDLEVLHPVRLGPRFPRCPFGEEAVEVSDGGDLEWPFALQPLPRSFAQPLGQRETFCGGPGAEGVALTLIDDEMDPCRHVRDCYTCAYAIHTFAWSPAKQTVGSGADGRMRTGGRL